MIFLMVQSETALNRAMEKVGPLRILTGRLRSRDGSVVPSGLNRFRGPLPTLKRWAIVARPSGTRPWSSLAGAFRDSNPGGIGLSDRAADRNVRAPV